MIAPLPKTIAWEGATDGALLVLDQTLLPHEISVLRLNTCAGVVDAITRLAVRGAPAIGVAAAYGLVLAVREQSPSNSDFVLTMRQQAEVLAATRPTAVNLRWAIDRCVRAGEREPTLAGLLREACLIHAEDVAACQAMGRYGAKLVAEGSTVITHCNAGRLATTGDGTALAVLFAAWNEGRRFSVLADETRPLLQGARLTALELAAAGIPVEVLCDGAAAGLMARGEIQMVLVGADRIAKNGDVANKVGTYGLALAAKAHDIPFYVVAPRSTFDPDIPDGPSIPIEERDAIEVTALSGQPLVASGVGARNPAFDLTPAALITALITDQGILEPPFPEAIKAMFAAGR